MNLLIVEDDEMLRDYLASTFGDQGYGVDAVESGEEALKRFAGGDYDLIILDLGLPGMNGFQVLKELRGKGDTTPLLILTSYEEEEGLIRGLDLGADDFIRKPFSMAELQAHVRALLRRANKYLEPVLSHGDIEMDLRRRMVKRRGRSVRLTEIQFKLLGALLTRRGELVSREELLKEVWGMDFDPHTKILDVQLTYLRKRLRAAGPPAIETVRGKGYRLVPSPPGSTA